MVIVIEGAGEVGSHLAKMLSNEANDITVIDSNAERLAKLSDSADVVTIEGNLSSIRVLKDAGTEHADLFIAVNPSTSQDANIVSALLAKKLGCKKVCARIDDEEYLSYENKYLFTEMGIDLMFYPEKIAAAEIAGLLKHSASTETMDFARGYHSADEFSRKEQYRDKQCDDSRSRGYRRDGGGDDLRAGRYGESYRFRHAEMYGTQRKH